MDTLSDLRQLADDLTALGDSATATLVRQAIDRFYAWKFEAGERLLERALDERRKHEHEPPPVALLQHLCLGGRLSELEGQRHKI
jgi:hypothetical protein